jgi:hypothetical protein
MASRLDLLLFNIRPVIENKLSTGQIRDPADNPKNKLASFESIG